MATKTVTQLTAISAGNLDDTAVFWTDDKNAATRKTTVAQLRTQINTGAQVFTAGATFAGAVSGITTLATTSTINGQTISATAAFTGSVTVGGATLKSTFKFAVNELMNVAGATNPLVDLNDSANPSTKFGRVIYTVATNVLDIASTADGQTHFTNVTINGGQVAVTGSTGAVAFAGNVTGSGFVTAAGVRSTGNPAYASGTGVELQHDGTTGIVVSFNRTGSAYTALVTDGLTTTMKVSGAALLTLTANTITAAASSTTALQALTATSVSGVTAAGSAVANSGVLDWSSGRTRITGYGTDASTNGAGALQTVRSDGTNRTTAMLWNADGTITFRQGGTVDGATGAIVCPAGISCTTLAGTGAVTGFTTGVFSSSMTAAAFASTRGTGSAPNSTATTFYTISTVGTYLVSLSLDVLGNIGTYIVVYGGGALSATISSAITAGSGTVTVSALDIQVTQSSGTTKAFTWNILKIA